MYSALTCQAFEGAFVSPNPQFQASAGPPYAGTSWQAAPGGVIQGRFGWGDPATGLASSAYVGPAQRLGVVIPQPSRLGQRTFFDPTVCTWRIRQGLPVTLAMKGPFWLRFASGANAADAVYASQVDGSAISGNTAGAILTPWKVATGCMPGGLAIVQQSLFFGA